MHEPTPETDRFHRQGFLILKQFFAADDTTRFSDGYRELIRMTLAKAAPRAPWSAGDFDGREFDAGLAALEAHDSRLVRQLYDASSHMPALLALVSGARMQALVNPLLGLAPEAPTYVFKPSCLIAPPHDERRTYDWHQEVFYTIPNSRFVLAWAPLIRDTRTDNGTIEVCEGSHRSGIAPQEWCEPSGRAVQIIVDDEYVRRYRARPVELSVGDLLVFKSTLFHRSGTNRSTAHRFSLGAMFHDYGNADFVTPMVRHRYVGITPREFYEQVSAGRYRDRGLYV